MSYRYGASSKHSDKPAGTTEFDILKARHRFLREGDEDGNGEGPSQPNDWDEQLAAKYYDSLYREFAICDLKHFKSGNFALRWRSEDEVISGTGETTCANSRCEFHIGSSAYRPVATPSLTTLELPFAYVEHGEQKAALVKVVLCPGCVRKLMWKRRKEKEEAQQQTGQAIPEVEKSGDLAVRESRSSRDRKEKRRSDADHAGSGVESRRRRRSRSTGGDSPRGEISRHRGKHNDRGARGRRSQSPRQS